MYWLDNLVDIHTTEREREREIERERETERERERETVQLICIKLKKAFFTMLANMRIH